MWEILNANMRRWGTETYPSKELAEQELRQFFRGVNGVDFKKFTIQQIVWKVRPYEGSEWRATTEPPTEEQRRYMEFVEVRPYTERSASHYDNNGYCDNPGRGY